MAIGFQGIDIVSGKQTAIQQPIGFFGLSVSIVDAPNLFISVKDSQGRAVRNCIVSVANATSGVPKSSNTDADGYVALKADSVNTITIINNKATKTYSYDRSTQGSQIVLVFDIPMIF